MNTRYNRHTLIDWFDQGKLYNARVVVVGVGAVGNEVLKNLALLGVGHIHIFDFDRIEEHNLTRSILFRDSDIGRYKAEVAAESCRNIDQNIQVQASCSDFWDELTLEEIRDANAVICCVDNYEARIRLNKLCLLTSTDYYNTGVDSRYSSVEMFPFSTDPGCACYECKLPASAYESIGKRYSCGWLRKVAFEEKKIPTTAITSSFTGAVVVSLFLNRINAHPHALQDSYRLFTDTITLASTLSVIQRNNDCITCKEIDPKATFVTANRHCAINSIFGERSNYGAEIKFSEPVLLCARCKLCNNETEYFESVNKVNDAITFCTQCNSQSIEPQFIEHVTVEEFHSLFAGMRVPCKFLICNSGDKQIILEMEG